MSTIKADAITAVTNDTDITITGAGSGVVKLGDGALKFPDSDGSAGQFIKTDGSAQLAFVDAGGGFTLGTEAATTTGSTVDLTGLTGAKQITITFEDVSLNASDHLLVQIGDSGGIETSSYVSTSCFIEAATPQIDSSTIGFDIFIAGSGDIYSGSITLSLKDSTNFTWVANHTGKGGTGRVTLGGGHKSLSAALTQVRVTRDGSSSFDNGSVNVLWS